MSIVAWFVVLVILVPAAGLVLAELVVWPDDEPDATEKARADVEAWLDYPSYGRRDFDAHVDQALAVAAPTPIGDSVARDLGDLWAVESVDDVLWLWGSK
jgi:hypothetical protein